MKLTFHFYCWQTKYFFWGIQHSITTPGEGNKARLLPTLSENFYNNDKSKNNHFTDENWFSVWADYTGEWDYGNRKTNLGYLRNQIRVTGRHLISQFRRPNKYVMLDHLNESDFSFRSKRRAIGNNYIWIYWCNSARME